MEILDFEALCRRVEELPTSMAILTHERADGDTLGSAEGLAILLRMTGRDVKVCSPDGIPEHLEFMGISICEPRNGDALVSVDVPSVEQLGRYGELASRISLMIDHHPKGDTYADCYRDGNAAAVGEIIFDLGRYFEEKNPAIRLPERFFAAVYTAVSSDTGCFKYANVNAGTHIRAAEMVNRGIDAAGINCELFDSHSPKEITATRLAYSALKISEDGAIASVTFTCAMQQEAGVKQNELGGIIDIPRGVRGVRAAAVLKQDTEDRRKYRVSLRSKGGLDVSCVAAEFSGGGHRKAAGCTVMADSPEDAENILFRAVRSAMEGQGIS